MAALERGDWVGAERAFREALRSQPSDAECIVNLALALEHLGRGDEAAELWYKAGQLDPARSALARRRFRASRTHLIWLTCLGIALSEVLSNAIRIAISGFDWSRLFVTTVETLVGLTALAILLLSGILLARLLR
jgi:tetratricopeptide (TPR) repeat protein